MPPLLLSRIRAHLRPQPAIPAVFALLLTSLFARMTIGQPEPGLLAVWGIPLGLLASAGLALAAGFCSFFPPMIWLVLAWWSPLISLNASIGMQVIAFWFATALAVAALGIQSWRVATGRFKPTIEVEPDTP